MKTQSMRSTPVMIVSSIVAAMALAAVLMFSGLADTAAGDGPWAGIFLAAFVAVIVLQVVPGLMLLGAMFKGFCSVVGKNELLIADQDPGYRREMAEHFKKAGYRVETAELPEEVMGIVSQMQAPVLLLGSDFSRQLPSSDLIHLFKKCNRNLHIVMVSDRMSLDQTRQVRQEGIFFQALKPASAADAAELSQVVDCAFKHQASVHGNTPALLARGRARLEAKAVSGRKPVTGALPWVAAVLAAVIGANYAALAQWVTSLAQGASLSTLIFIAFCALLVTCQMVPIFRVKLKRAKLVQMEGAKEEPPSGD